MIYRVMFKTDADEDSRNWPLGPFRSKDEALLFFNSTDAKTLGIGMFVFVDAISDYCLVERSEANGPESYFPIGVI